MAKEDKKLAKPNKTSSGKKVVKKVKNTNGNVRSSAAMEKQLAFVSAMMPSVTEMVKGTLKSGGNVKILNDLFTNNHNSKNSSRGGDMTKFRGKMDKSSLGNKTNNYKKKAAVRVLVGGATVEGTSTLYYSFMNKTMLIS